MGRVFSLETRQRMSEAAKARCTPEWRETKSAAQRADIDESVLRRLYVDEGLTQQEAAAAMGTTQKVIWRALKRFGIPAHPQIKRNQRGALNDAWKGDDATYTALHLRVATERGKPSLCSQCGATHGRFEWANLTGKYEDVSDYQRLCVSCHRQLDAYRRAVTGERTSPIRKK